MRLLFLYGEKEPNNLLKEPTDDELLRQLPQVGEPIMELIFRRHYEAVCKAVFRIIPEQSTSEDLAQDVFYELWRRKDSLQITTSLGAYLRRAAVNKALNVLRGRKIRLEEDDQLGQVPSAEADAQRMLEAEELQQLLSDSVASLPEKCRVIFVLSRFEHMSYGEIAAQLQIAPKTVENQISKALRLLRQALGHYLGLIMIFFYSG